jgi:hypothetical protein
VHRHHRPTNQADQDAAVVTLDEARKALFDASRVLSKAHAHRLRSYKSDMAAVQVCRDADRDLQRAAIEFTAAFIEAQPEGPVETVAALVRGVKDLVK